MAAVWFALRALEDGRTRWLVLSGIAVGLGFETKMGVALMVVPGIALPGCGSPLAAAAQRCASCSPAAQRWLAVGGAWPLLVALTPAADRPWISGTSDNSIFSLIFGYNGLGRVAGQSAAPVAAVGGGVVRRATGPFRLLQSCARRPSRLAARLRASWPWWRWSPSATATSRSTHGRG